MVAFSCKRALYILSISLFTLVISACNLRVIQPAVVGNTPTSIPDTLVSGTPDTGYKSTPTVQVTVTPFTITTDPVVGATSPSTPEPAEHTLPFQGSSTPISTAFWMSLPVIPQVSQTAREIYQRGIELGRDPHAFSKIGDCQSITTYFLASFDQPGQFNLGTHTSLQDTLDWFKGSFSRQSVAVKGGYNAAAVLSPLRSDPEQCKPDENPIQCEFRLHNPSLVLISLEEWWVGHPENYEKYMRQIIEYAIDQGVVPIIATKADNLEGDHLINQTIANLAIEYDIPLWNFWLAVQPLPNHGLIAKDSNGNPDMFHLTHRENYYFFNNRVASRCGMSVRNLTALQALDAVWQGLTGRPD